jgi:hypothetical protein
MLFSEIYCAYFNTVASIIQETLKEKLDEKQLLQIIDEKAFSESMLTILPAIKNEDWLVLNKEFDTPMKHIPQMPLTMLQKQWLKALLTDPRIVLFDVGIAGMEDIEPLFSYDDFVFFDRYSDGDPYTDMNYIAHFKMILQALKEKRRLYIQYYNRHGVVKQGRYIPYKLEYSAKDNKFRLEIAGSQSSTHINLARIAKCKLLESYTQNECSLPKRRERFVTFTLRDKRNALNRVMLHFSDCRKETRRLDNECYQVDLWYEIKDETEILIRLLSFGAMLQVTAPNKFISLIKNRLAMQVALKK